MKLNKTAKISLLVHFHSFIILCVSLKVHNSLHGNAATEPELMYEGLPTLGIVWKNSGS